MSLHSPVDLSKNTTFPPTTDTSGFKIPFKFGTKNSKLEPHLFSNQLTNKSNTEKKSNTENKSESPQNQSIEDIKDNLKKLEKCDNAVTLDVIKMLNRNILEMAECCNDNEKLGGFNDKLDKLIRGLQCKETQSGGAKRTRRRKAKRKSKRKSKRHSRR